jgi:hypothetical protein
MPDPKQQNVSDEPKPSESLPEKPAGEIAEGELDSVSGGRTVRITNVRANATALSGGSAAGATPVIS